MAPAAVNATVGGECAFSREWSVLEVVNHLAEEETDDVRARLDLTLHRPGERCPPIDPPGVTVGGARSPG